MDEPEVVLLSVTATTGNTPIATGIFHAGSYTVSGVVAAGTIVFHIAGTAIDAPSATVVVHAGPNTMLSVLFTAQSIFGIAGTAVHTPITLGLGHAGSHAVGRKPCTAIMFGVSLKRNS